MKSFTVLSLGLAATAALASSLPVHADYVAHEWGTFTSVQGSDGKPLEGLQHSDEPLPSFVYGRDTGQPETVSFFKEPQPRTTKRMETPLKSGTLLAVNEKLETPVIYFYSDDAQKVSVDVRFPGGVISEWYPNASSFSPELGSIQSLANGRMSWEVQLSNDKTPLKVPPVAPSSIWAPARKVGSNYLSTPAGENEKFIFYRGLGKFSVPIEVRAQAGLVHVTNGSKQAIPAAFLIRYDGQQGFVHSLGQIRAGATRSTEISDKPLDETPYLAEISRHLKDALIASGLYADEAQAMIDTWSRSYFKTPGTRILYVLPRAWTDSLLPLTLKPAPSSLVRTLVGRIEVMSVDEEARIISEVMASSGNASDDQAIVGRLGRFAEPKLLRARELRTDAAFRAKADRLLKRVE
jgi:hypothetical protein